MWITNLFTQTGVVQTIILLSIVIVLGLALGNVSFKGIKLGIGGVLFSGLFIGYMNLNPDKHLLEFIREFGLILFVFSVGLQVGPSFVDSLKRRGLVLNIFAFLIVLSGTLIAFFLGRYFNLSETAIAGLYSGAVTNTPSLGAATTLFSEISATKSLDLDITEVSVNYAIAYPFGIFGIILTMLFIKGIFKISISKEIKKINEETSEHIEIASKTLCVTNSEYFGRTLNSVLGEGHQVIVSRVQEENVEEQHLAADEVILEHNLHIHLIGERGIVNSTIEKLGYWFKKDMNHNQETLETRHILVTKPEVIGKRLGRLRYFLTHAITITGINRAGTEFLPNENISLHYADEIVAVGTKDTLDGAEKLLGNSTKTLGHPPILPIFLGIVLGIIVGSIPITLPFFDTTLKLGLAGGSLLVAIFLSRVHSFKGIVWYLPASAHHIMREMGIALFLAAVGINAGASFFEALFSLEGLKLFFVGVCITFVPLFTFALIARVFFKLNFIVICGLLSGSMTDPPALAFAQDITHTDLLASFYASVYPLTMLLRIISAQILVLLLYAF